MVIAQPKFKRLEWARTMLIAMSIITFAGILTYPMGTILVFFACLGSIVIIGTQLVFEVQMHLLDLVLLTMAFGNIFGWTFGNSQGSWLHDADRWLFGLSSIVLVLGAYRNALITAQRLAIKNTIERLWLVIVYLLLPFAVVELIVLAVFILIGQFETAALLLLLAYSAGVVLIFGYIYWRDMQVIQTPHQNGR